MYYSQFVVQYNLFSVGAIIPVHQNRFDQENKFQDNVFNFEGSPNKGMYEPRKISQEKLSNF